MVRTLGMLVAEQTFNGCSTVHIVIPTMGETVTSAAHRTAPRRARAPLSVRC